MLSPVVAACAASAAGGGAGRHVGRDGPLDAGGEAVVTRRDQRDEADLLALACRLVDGLELLLHERVVLRVARSVRRQALLGRAQEHVAVRRHADADLFALDVQDDDAEVTPGLVVELLLLLDG
jgi:hypothetical protein